MKPSLLALATLAATLAGPARGAGLPATTAVHVEPSAQSTVATYLKAGEDPRPAAAATAPAAAPATPPAPTTPASAPCAR